MLANLHSCHAPLVLSQVEEAGVLSGTAAVWGNENANGVVFERGAFSDWLGAGNVPALLWQHDEREPIGMVTSARETDDGLAFSAALNLATVRGREAHALLTQGAIRGVSMGVLATKSGATESGARLITACELWELSLVTFPAEPGARVATVSSITPGALRTRAIRALHAALTKRGTP